KNQIAFHPVDVLSPAHLYLHALHFALFSMLQLHNAIPPSKANPAYPSPHSFPEILLYGHLLALPHAGLSLPLPWLSSMDRSGRQYLFLWKFLPLFMSLVHYTTSIAQYTYLFPAQNRQFFV